jgi:hypothetical protein
MKRSRIELKLDSTVDPPRIRATAIDEAGNESPSGNLLTRPNRNIQWIHAGGTDKSFEVSFLDLNDPTGTPWPFAPTNSNVLCVPDGKQIEKKLKFHPNKDWEYTVKLSDCESLDPMIIIRSSRSWTVASLALIGGLVAGALIAWQYFARWN